MSKQTRNISQKTFGERIFHAVGFETIAVLISAPAAAWALNKPVWEMGALAIMLSTTAMVWNIVYNSLFDKFWRFPAWCGHLKSAWRTRWGSKGDSS